MFTEPVLSRLFQAVFTVQFAELIEKDRNHKMVDRTVLRDFISMFIDVKGGDLKSYKADLERIYLEETTKYYLKTAQKMVHSMSCRECLRECGAIIEAEQQRELDYLHHSIHSELLKRLYAVLLVGPQTQIINMPSNGVYEMIESEDTDSLSLLFKLY